jgi:uncharacterized protein involved in exopolysaccharide biosynthesis
LLYNNVQELEREKAGLLVKVKYIDYLKDYVKNENNLENVVVPSSLGLTDPVLNSLIDKLVSLQLENNQLKNVDKRENPLILYNKKKVEEIKTSLLENINNLDKANKIALSDLNSRISMIASSMQRLPGAESEFINIQRVYSLSETLYLFLMEKRAEASIAKASNTADFKVVNAAKLKGVGGPIKPLPSRNYIIALFLGIILPVASIYFKDLFNNKITTQEELLSYTKIPFLGIIGHNKNEGDNVIANNPNL